ncbi:MAG: hypothetical protein ACRD2N_17140 [Vicinamibacterales bacterium]
MLTPKLKVRHAAAIAFVPAVLLVAGCARPPEQQFLTQFFRASKARDNTTTSMMSAVTIDPREEGTVESFTITSIGPERRSPLNFKALLEAETNARSDETEFLKTKIEYQNANLKIINEILKLEQDPKAKLTPAQQKVKVEWDKWREGIGSYQKAVSAARAALVAATGPAEASLTQPGQPTLDPKAFEGETVTKDVVVAAKIKTADGKDVDKTLTVTFARVSGTLGGTKREGRPVITRIAGL